MEAFSSVLAFCIRTVLTRSPSSPPLLSLLPPAQPGDGLIGGSLSHVDAFGVAPRGEGLRTGGGSIANSICLRLDSTGLAIQ